MRNLQSPIIEADLADVLAERLAWGYCPLMVRAVPNSLIHTAGAIS